MINLIKEKTNRGGYTPENPIIKGGRIFSRIVHMGLYTKQETVSAQ